MTNGGSSYRAKRTNTGKTPATSGNDWEVLAAKGARGIQGTTGVAGTDGAAGPQGLPGATGAIGPAGAQGLTGAVGPKGATGPAGPAGRPGVWIWGDLWYTSSDINNGNFIDVLHTPAVIAPVTGMAVVTLSGTCDVDQEISFTMGVRPVGLAYSEHTAMDAQITNYATTWIKGPMIGKWWHAVNAGDPIVEVIYARTYRATSPGPADAYCNYTVELEVY